MTVNVVATSSNTTDSARLYWCLVLIIGRLPQHFLLMRGTQIIVFLDQICSKDKLVEFLPQGFDAIAAELRTEAIVLEENSDVVFAQLGAELHERVVMCHIVVDSFDDIEDFVGIRACEGKTAEALVGVLTQIALEVLVGSRAKVEPESPVTSEGIAPDERKLVYAVENILKCDCIIIFEFDCGLFALLLEALARNSLAFRSLGLTAKRLSGPHSLRKYSFARHTMTLCTLISVPSLSLVVKSEYAPSLNNWVVSMAGVGVERVIGVADGIFQTWKKRSVGVLNLGEA